MNQAFRYRGSISQEAKHRKEREESVLGRPPRGKDLKGKKLRRPRDAADGVVQGPVRPGNLGRAVCVLVGCVEGCLFIPGEM